MPNYRTSSNANVTVDFDIVEAARLDPRLGPEISTLRKAKRLTLEQVANLTGLSVGFISQIERNKNRPSVSAMYKLSRALGVSVNWFFFTADNDERGEASHLVRGCQRRVIEFDDGIRDELLTPNLAGRLELLSCTFEPGSGVDAAYTHEGDEAGVVVEGELELWVDKSHYRLKTGDSFSFNNALPHRYRNPTDKKTVVIWAITPPSF